MKMAILVYIGVYRILCHKIYPERTLRWEELCCSGKEPRNWEREIYLFISAAPFLYLYNE